MSAQQLSDECARLGMAIPRGLIAKLESGVRDVVSVDELLVLAAGLGIPPSQLLFPLDQGTVEMLPGVRADPWAATTRLAGLDSDEMKLFAEYAAAEQYLRSLLRASVNRGGWVLDVPERKQIPAAFRMLVQARQQIADRQLTEPELADDVQNMLEIPHILDGESDMQAKPGHSQAGDRE